MTVAVVADAHLGGPGGDADRLVSQLLALTSRPCDRLLLLGDLFEVWVGNRRFETEEIAAVTAALAAVKSSGTRLSYVEGNRDFFIAGSSYGELFDSVGAEVEFPLGDRRCLAVHGDGIDDRDYLYRFWRRVSKNPLSRMAMNGLPRSLARALIHSFERELAKTNFKHKRRFPVEVIESYARGRLKMGFDLVVLGHFHEAFSRRLPEGEILVFDAWFRSHNIEWLPETLESGRSA